MAHIHQGSKGTNGPVVAFLFGPNPAGQNFFDVSGTIREGDLVFQDLACGMRCALIRQVTHSRYVHVGLVLMEDGERVVYDASFDDPGLPGTLKTSVTLKAVRGGTDIAITQEGIPEAIPVEMCYLGWQESLVALAQLVEAVSPD